MDGQSDETPPKQTARTNVQNFTNRALEFLSTASNETLVGCLVGLSAVTYLVLGRVGLLLIGTVCGVVLHATWDESSQDAARNGATAIEIKRRREAGLDIIHRVLDWQQKKEGSLTEDDGHEIDILLYAGKTLDFADFKPATGAALTGLVDAVIRDYVKYLSLLPTLYKC